MSDLFLPPLTPGIGTNRVSQLEKTAISPSSETNSKAYNRTEAFEMQDHTLAWVQSLPSPNNDVLFFNEAHDRPNSRILETPRPNLEAEDLHISKLTQRNLESSSSLNEMLRKPFDSKESTQKSKKKVKKAVDKNNHQLQGAFY